MSLPATKYPTNMRVVTGTPTIYNDDVVLLCNTSAGAVTINLLDIPNDYWSTQYKLYVIDNSNNAGTNNITINAGTGQTINGASSITISSNGGQYLVRISSNTTYIGEYNGCCGGGGLALHLVTNAELLTAISGDTLVQGDFYLVTDVSNTNPYVMLQAITTNAIATNGSGYFLNADYQNVGVYTDVSGFVAQTGLWNDAGTYVIGDVVIWNNLHWENISGDNTGNPSSTPDDWSELEKSLTTGYIAEVDFVVYDPDTNLVRTRYDKRNNEVDYYDDGEGRNTLVDFPFGSGRVTYNKVKGLSVCYFCNSSSIFESNIIENGTLYDSTNISQGDTGVISLNQITSQSVIAITNTGSNTGIIQSNVLANYSQIRIDNSINSGNIRLNNLLVNGYLSVRGNTNSITKNELVDSSVFVVSNDGEIEENIFNQPALSGANTTTISNNSGSFLYNVLTGTSYVNIQENTGNIEYNVLNQHSYIEVATTNSGNITYNNLIGASYIQFEGNSGSINYNSLKENSYIEINTTNAGNITYNNLSNNSYLQINTLSGGNVYKNEISDYSYISINDIVSDGYVQNNIVKIYSYITIPVYVVDGVVGENRVEDHSYIDAGNIQSGVSDNIVTQYSHILVSVPSPILGNIITDNSYANLSDLNTFENNNLSQGSYVNMDSTSLTTFDSNTLNNASYITDVDSTSSRSVINYNSLNNQSYILIGSYSKYNVENNSLNNVSYFDLGLTGSTLNNLTCYVKRNMLETASYFNLRVLPGSSTSQNINENILNSSHIIATGLTGTTTANQNNLSANSYINLTNSVTTCNLNQISETSYITLTSSTMPVLRNTLLSQSYITMNTMLVGTSGSVNDNQLSSLSYLELLLCTGTIYKQNEISSESYIIDSSSNDGTIQGNNVSQTSYIASNLNSSFIGFNNLTQESSISVTTNESVIGYNTINGASNVTLNENVGYFLENVVKSQSYVTIASNSAGEIRGNIVSINSFIEVTTDNFFEIKYNNISTSSYMSIATNRGFIGNNTLNGESHINVVGSVESSGSIKDNVLNSNSYISAGTLSGATYISENNISASSYIKVDDAVTLTNSYIKQNTISAISYIRVLANSTGNNIWQNFLNSYSYLTTTGAHTGNIRGNNIQLTSYITITSSVIGPNIGGSDLSGNEVYDYSNITIGASRSQIDGNILRYQSSVAITTCNYGSYFTGNQILFNSMFTITTNGGDTIANKLEQNSIIVLGTKSNLFNYNQATQGGQFNIATLSGDTTYCIASDGQNVTQNITSTTTNKVARQGYSNWEWTLDLSSGSVYSGTAVTIPLAQSYVGIFNLTNCGAKVISSIVNSPSKQRFQLKPADTTYVLTPIAIAGAVANNIVVNHYTNVGGGANTITYRATGCDYVLFELEGTIVGVVEKNSWA
jgi:hypothetical protein